MVGFGFCMVDSVELNIGSDYKIQFTDKLTIPAFNIHSANVFNDTNNY